MGRGAPALPSFAQRQANLFGDIGSPLKEGHRFQQPGCNSRLNEPVVYVTALASLCNDAVGTKNAEVLGHSGVWDLQQLLERCNVQFAASEFFHNANSFGMS